MPPERFPPDDPREWLHRARSNLALAKARLPDVLLDDLCFEAQQGAEKAIKAVLVARGIAFPYVHDVRRLLTLLEDRGETFPFAPEDVARLTPFAVVSRYPDFDAPIAEETYRWAVTIAAAVVGWAEVRVEAERRRSGE